MPVLLPLQTKIEASPMTLSGVNRRLYGEEDHTFTISRSAAVHRSSGVDAVAAAAAVVSTATVENGTLDVLEASSLLLSMSKQARVGPKKEKKQSVSHPKPSPVSAKKGKKKAPPRPPVDDELTDDEDMGLEELQRASRFPNLEVDTSEYEDDKVRQRTTISPRFEKTTARRPLQKPITLEELKLHFNKPIVDVAKEFGVCITLMKKICRKNGIKRWPHRLIRSLDKRIQNAEISLQTATGSEHQRCQEQLIMLKRKLEAVFENPNIKMKETELDALEYHPLPSPKGAPARLPSTPSASTPSPSPTPAAMPPAPQLSQSALAVSPGTTAAANVPLGAAQGGHSVSISSILSPAPISPVVKIDN